MPEPCPPSREDDSFLLEGTRLFKRWEAMKQEILLHKWYESERAGYDIGWEKACVDWRIRHGARFSREQPDSPAN